MPRLDWSGGCPSLKLEPQRTNLVTNSEYIADTVTWKQLGSALVCTPNEAISPDGYVNASKIVLSAVTAKYYTSEGLTVVSGNSYTFSVWMKAETGTLDVGLALFNGSGNTLVSVTNEWQEFAITRTTTTTTEYVGIDQRIGGASTSGNLLIWGAQLEAGSYGTSYIPSYGTATTRAADACNGAGTSATFNSTEGVLYAEIAALADDLTNRWITLYQSASYNSNQVNLRYGAGSNLIQIVSRAPAVGQDVVLSYTLTDETVNNKIAFRYKLNDWALAVNGVIVATDTSSTAFAASSLDTLSFHRGNSTNPFYGNTNQVLVFNTALSDTELEKLTTL
jgi:hypothetical protein